MAPPRVKMSEARLIFQVRFWRCEARHPSEVTEGGTKP
jgi:hypothetical protein